MTTGPDEVNEGTSRLLARLERERRARKEAEKLLEGKSRSLYEANSQLEQLHFLEKQNAVRLRNILDGLPLAVLTTTGACAIENINYAARSYFGTTPHLVKDRSIGTFLPRFADIADVHTAINIVEMAGEIFSARRSDGNEFPCEVFITRIGGDDDETYIWMVRDITARVETEKRRQQLEADLRQAHRLESLGTMAGGIAHELNTPIQFISDNLRFLSDAFVDIGIALGRCRRLIPPEEDASISADGDLEFLSAEIPSALQQSLEGIGRVAEIVLAIKRFSHPSSDTKEANDLNQIVTTTATVARNQWKYVAELELDLEPNLPLVKSNAGELNQVLINLIVNAAHAIEDRGEKDHKGKIIVRTRSIEDGVVCSVSDTGIGVAPENRDKIFDLFFTTKAPGRGTGQGLSLVHTIVTQSHGGRIAVASEPGQGTTISITLPLNAQSAPAVTSG